MISYDGIQKSEIRNHYNLATFFYWLLWGNHIHHGLWNADEPIRQAQKQLIDHLLRVSGIPCGSAVVDVGCGMGGSSIHLAREHDCRVTGVTLSGLQRNWATATARFKGVAGRTQFIRQDAEDVDFADQSFDYLWSIECTEHLFDKPAFFRRAAGWLKPGGGAALCVWHAGDEPHGEDDIRQVEAVCDAFLCPSLGSVEDYKRWLTDAGLVVTDVCDLTSRVAQTWAICKQRVERSGVSLLSRVFGQNMVQFVDNFETIFKAYESGAMKYCSIVASKPQ